MSPDQRTLLTRALVIIQELLSAPEERSAAAIRNPAVPVSDMDRLAHAGARIRPADRGQWQLLLDEHGLVKTEIAVKAVRPAYIEDVRRRLMPEKRLKSWDVAETILKRSALPSGSKQIEEWAMLGREVACCTSPEEWADFIEWAIITSEEKGEDFKYANQYRGYAITWRRDRHERWVRKAANQPAQDQAPPADPVGG